MANGIVERFHRSLKASLVAHSDFVNWNIHLPVVLLSLRTTPKEDLGVSPARVVYGTPLHLPGECFVPPDQSLVCDPASYFMQLSTTMRSL